MEKERIPALFGSSVFNEDAMRRYLPSEAVDAWRDCLENSRPLGLPLANAIADGMKNWALEHGATHYTHWFQPMTGYTAEKHDSFITPVGPGRVIMDFSGKELVSGEPDASSFPSGGLRATFEARGYTAWDPTSYAFLKDGSLCIPTVFCSYSGESLDKKTPLLRSVEAVSKQAVRILRLFGDTETHRVIPQVGPEQEYFLLDKECYKKREDLIMTGRTLFGAKPPRGQELEDHYFGAIRPRVAAYMQDLDNELWKLGVLSKTKHNEVAPAQHEMAPVYCDANAACDQNQITMEIMKKVADRHGLVCLLHEKPFSGVNGSGKHDNWSLGTDTGKNLFKPGSTPRQNAQFLLFLTAFIKGVDEYQDMLRATVATPGNDHRLGAQEAPPVIVSIFLGEEMSGVVNSIINDTAYSEVGKRTLEIGVDSMPSIPQDNTDRNRTSPMAFTGNKFEFRMLGSAMSLADPNTVLNTILAEELGEFADKLEGASDVDKAAKELAADVFAKHSRIIFNGDGYTDEWVVEAEKRGLSNLRTCADAYPAYIADKNVKLFEKHNIFSKEELTSRYEIGLENYCKTLHIEALTMTEMVKKDIYPAVLEYMGTIAENITKKKAISDTLPCESETTLLTSLSTLADSLMKKCEALETALVSAEDIADIQEQANFYRDTVFVAMQEMRAVADELETLTAKDYWPFPTYSDLLYSVV